MNSRHVTKARLIRLSRQYAAALQRRLKQGPRASVMLARRLGRQAMAIGLGTLGLARIHEQALASLDGSGTRDGMIKRANIFFAEAMAPLEKTHRGARDAKVQLNQLNETLGQRTADLADSNRCLKQGIIQRKAVEKALQKSGEHYTKLWEESRRLQKHLRHLTHRMLSAHEDERKKISLELHDEIAQTLLGINVRLLTLKGQATANATGLKKEIASTQRLVKSSVKTMNRFAREFGTRYET
jgi:signal transduction histidine kinase